jgi:hypothetical protein
MKFDDGLIVTAGTINPYSPRTAIASEGIPLWLENGQEQQPAAPDDAQDPPTKAK